MSLIIEPFSTINIAHLMRWVQTERELLQWAGPTFPWPLSETFLLTHFSTNQQQRLTYQAMTTDTNCFLGMFEINLQDNETGKLSRIITAPNLRGNGIGQIMLAKGISHIFRAYPLEKIELVVFSFNQAAIKCYQNLGFIHDRAIDTEARVFQDESWELRAMSVSRLAFKLHT